MNLIKAKHDLELGKRINEYGCWIWPFAKDSKGYGTVMNDGVQYVVSRLSAHIFLGFDLKSKEKVLHKCDNPACFNPECFFFGNDLDNARDRDTKGRGVISVDTQFKTKDVCLNGHPRIPENILVNKGCRVCANIRNKERRRKLSRTVYS